MARRVAIEARARRALGMRRNRRKRLPRQQEPKGIYLQYARELRGIARHLRTLIRPLLDELPALTRSARAEILDGSGSIRADAGELARARALIRQLMERSSLDTSRVSALARSFAEKTDTHARRQLEKQTRAALGADVFVGNSRLLALVEDFTAENVSLITNMLPKTISEIEGIVMRGVQAGKLHTDLAKEISERIGIGERRAALIARDQVGKFYGVVQRQRQRDLGLRKFRWVTVGDERVRDEHVALDGQVFEWTSPPSEGIPGQPINCRCFPEPIFDEILEALD